MKVYELINVMVDYESIIIKQSISKTDYFKGVVKDIPDRLKDREIVYLSHTKEDMYIAVE